MRGRTVIGARALLLCVLLASGFFAARVGVGETEKDDAAQNVTRLCAVEATGSHPYFDDVLLKGRMNGAISFAAKEVLTVSWEEAVAAEKLCLRWERIPEEVELLQYDAAGTLLERKPISSHLIHVLPLHADARRAEIRIGFYEAALSLLSVYTDGALPEPYLEWKDTPQKLDYLVVATHPDDDVLFMGAVVPTYGAERGYVGSIAYATCGSRTRYEEAENGAWAMGLRYRPLFLGLPDQNERPDDEVEEMFRFENVTRLLVRLFRRYRPAVVFAQDLNGEYGHWQHRRVAACTLEAAKVCADPSYDRESAVLYGAWQVQKCYLHLYPENTLTIESEIPLSSMGGRTAIEVARAAFQKHVSQATGRYFVQSAADAYACNRFGMAWGAVEAGDDAFANIDEKLLSSRAAATPAPTDTPMPTDSPIDSPAPTETALPTSSPVPPTEALRTEPAANADPLPSTETERAREGSGIWTGILLLILVGIVWIVRKR